MAIVFCNDGGSNTSPYDTWAKAAQLFLTAVDFASLTDNVIHIGADHTEAIGTTTYTFPGIIDDPTRVISVTPDTTTYSKASSAQLTSSGTNDINIGGSVEFYGVFFELGDDLSFNGLKTFFDDSTIELSRTGGSLISAQADKALVRLKNTLVDYSGATGTPSPIILADVTWIWEGGAVSYGGNRHSSLFNLGAEPANVIMSGVDLSALDTAIINIAGTDGVVAEIHHCLLNSSVSMTTGTINSLRTRVLMSGCDDTTGNKLYRLEYVDFWGSTVHDDATFRTTGGASDGTTPISLKMVSTANAVEFSEPTKSLPIPGKWIDSTGSKTFTVNCLWDSAIDIQNDEVWLELEFLEAAADTDSAFADDRSADILAAPADQTTNAVPWTISPSMTNANEFEVSVTVTVNRVGPVIARVCLAKPSTTIFVDPKIEVT